MNPIEEAALDRSLRRLVACWLLAAAPLLASDHRDAPLTAEDPTVDLADLYVFPSPGAADRVVLAVTASPLLVPGIAGGFSPHARYEFRIDSSGDAVADLVLTAEFSGSGPGQRLELIGPRPPGRERAGATLSGQAGTVLRSGDLAAYAGLRDDPFFFDQQAFFTGGRLRDPGVDFYAGRNVVALVVELPLSRLLPPSGAGVLRVWAVSSRPSGKRLLPQDRVGLPALNAVLVPPGERDAFNAALPAGDAGRFGPGLDESLAALGISDPAARGELVARFLPDVLTFDPARPSGFPNGRRLEDDAIDTVLGLLAAKGAAIPTDPEERPSDHVDGNDVPFSAVFPYLAEPHRPR